MALVSLLYSLLGMVLKPQLGHNNVVFRQRLTVYSIVRGDGNWLVIQRMLTFVIDAHVRVEGKARVKALPAKLSSPR